MVLVGRGGIIRRVGIGILEGDPWDFTSSDSFARLEHLSCEMAQGSETRSGNLVSR